MSDYRRLVIGVVMLLLTGSIAAETTTILLVRHAEKAATAGDDPELTQEGRARAEKLATAIEDVDIAAIYSTPFKRTRDTVAPIASAKGIEVIVTEAGPGFTDDLAARILEDHRGETVLVVGHSNTLGATIQTLGGGPAVDLDESEYGDLFVCTIPDGGVPVVLRLKF
jgi:broad specificity phosphatase PhoE